MDTHEEEAALDALLKREATRHAAPPGLIARIRSDVQRADAPLGESGSRWRQWLSGLALCAAGAAVAWGVAGLLLVPSAPDRLGQEVTASHVRSLMASHLADVASSDRHTVKPWFAGKLDFSPPVQDLAAEGYPLIGGRLDVIDGRSVAALVYQQRQHVINLFVWPASGGTPMPPALLMRQGYCVAHWTQGGMQFWAVSDLNAPDMQAFADKLSARMAAG